MNYQRICLFALTLLSCPLVANFSPSDLNRGYSPSLVQDEERFGVTLGVDYLLWTANQAGLSYATNAAISFSPVVLNEEDLFLNDRPWDSGLRATLGFKPPCRSWDARLSYTYFRTEKESGLQTGSFDGVDGNIILTDYGANFISLVEFSTSNQTNWTLLYNLLDLDFGREFFICKDTRLRPFFGIRAIETKQTIEQTFTSLIPNDDTPLPSNNNVESTNKFRGIGIKAGLDVSYELGYGFDLFGSLTGGLLWGQFNLRQAIVIDSINGEGTPFTFIEETIAGKVKYETIFNADFSLCLRWNCWLNACHDVLTLRFGWEQHLLTNMNQLERFIVDQLATGTNGASVLFDRNVQRGDLTLQGFVFGLNYAF